MLVAAGRLESREHLVVGDPLEQVPCNLERRPVQANVEDFRRRSLKLAGSRCR